MELCHRLLAHRGAKYDLLKEELKRLGLRFEFNPNGPLSSIEFEFSDQDPGDRRPYCGRVKYHWPLTKPLRFESKALAKLPDFAKSAEYFGSGGAANRFILARSRVLKLVSDMGLRGLSAKRPIHLVSITPCPIP
jgi:hypothetical protein